MQNLQRTGRGSGLPCHQLRCAPGAGSGGPKQPGERTAESGPPSPPPAPPPSGGRQRCCQREPWWQGQETGGPGGWPGGLRDRARVWDRDAGHRLSSREHGWGPGRGVPVPGRRACLSQRPPALPSAAASLGGGLGRAHGAVRTGRQVGRGEAEQSVAGRKPAHPPEGLGPGPVSSPCSRGRGRSRGWGWGARAGSGEHAAGRWRASGRLAAAGRPGGGRGGGGVGGAAGGAGWSHVKRARRADGAPPCPRRCALRPGRARCCRRSAPTWAPCRARRPGQLRGEDAADREDAADGNGSPGYGLCGAPGARWRGGARPAARRAGPGRPRSEGGAEGEGRGGTGSSGGKRLPGPGPSRV